MTTLVRFQTVQNKKAVAVNSQGLLSIKATFSKTFFLIAISSAFTAASLRSVSDDSTCDKGRQSKRVNANLGERLAKGKEKRKGA